MPLELGIDVGCRIFGETTQSETLSHSGGATLSYQLLCRFIRFGYTVHADLPRLSLRRSATAKLAKLTCKLPGPARVWTAFLDFMSDNYVALKNRGFSDRDAEFLPMMN